MSKIRHVFLDLDDTLFDFHKTEAKALTEALTAMEILPSDEVLSLYSKINREMWESLERGENDRKTILTKRFELLFTKLGLNRNPNEAQALYEGALCRIYYYTPGAEKLLEALYAKYKLYVASNGTAKVQDSRIRLSGIEKYFDGIFISERVGYDKPSREFFERCFLSIEDFSKDETLIIGDSLTSDILGGMNAGIKTCLYNPNGKPKRPNIVPDYTVFSLDEIPGLLEKIQ